MKYPPSMSLFSGLFFKTHIHWKFMLSGKVITGDICLIPLIIGTCPQAKWNYGAGTTNENLNIAVRSWWFSAYCKRITIPGFSAFLLQFSLCFFLTPYNWQETRWNVWNNICKYKLRQQRHSEEEKTSICAGNKSMLT